MITRSKIGIHKPKVFSYVASICEKPITVVSVQQALAHPNWKTTMNFEFQGPLNNHTWI